MSDRNRDDYYDYNNFDDSIDSRDYRRRQPNRRQPSYNGRPSYNRRRPKKKLISTRTRNRIVIVSLALLVLVLLIMLIVFMFRGCKDDSKNTDSVSRETKSQQEQQANGSQASGGDIESTTGAVVTSGDKLKSDVFIAPNPTDNGGDGYSAGLVYVWNNTAFELFGGSDYSAELYAETVNGLADKLIGMNVYSMIVPNHTEMGLPQREKEKASTNSQADNIKAAYAAMDTSKVTPVNCYNYLSEHCNEYIYFNSDHHWTGLGSYYAYKAFADTLGMTPLSLGDCTENTVEGFTGTLIGNDSSIEPDTVHYWTFPYDVSMTVYNNADDSETYDSPYYPWAEGGPNTYGVFIVGDHPLTVMRSSSPNAEKGRKIVVVKESYGNAFVPYLTSNFEEVHVADLRYFRDASPDVNLANYCRQNGITDVLFINGVMSANDGDRFDQMEALFK